MPVYPGDPEPELMALSSLKRDGVLSSQLTTGLHVGTHIDAPAHMTAGGQQLADIPTDQLAGRGVLIDARDKPSITATLLHGVELQSNDIVLVWTGWSHRFREPAYFTNFPVFEEAFAERLVDAGIALVGVDTASPDAVVDEAELANGEPAGFYPIHQLLLGSGILVAENLTNLDQLAKVENFEVIALPLRIAADGAPARIVARI